MSHFSVLVVSDEQPTEESLRTTLLPWHEFECTGEDNEYVQDVDQTDEARAAYEHDTVSRLRDADGKLWSPYDPTVEEAAKHGPFIGTGFGGGLSFTSKDWGDGKGYRGKIRFVPDGFEEVKVATKDVQSFRDFVEGYYGKKPVLYGEEPDLTDGDAHKYGYALLDQSGDVVRVIDRTNPNKRWDWYQLGGRYSGRLLPKRGTDSASKGKRSWTNEDQEIVGFDTCQVCDLDMEAMQAQRSAERLAWINEIVTKSGLDRGDVDRAIKAKPIFHAEWMTLPEPRPRGGEYHDWLRAKGELGAICATASNAVWELPEVGDLSVAEWITQAPAITSFAVVKDGQWFENGRMGWWAVVHDEKADWEQRFIELFASLRPDQFVSIVDCHI